MKISFYEDQYHHEDAYWSFVPPLDSKVCLGKSVYQVIEIIFTVSGDPQNPSIRVSLEPLRDPHA